MSRTDLTFEDHLPLNRLYDRFDDIAEGLVPGDSSAAHQAVLDRLAANQQAAEALGWSACALERQGGSGRLVVRGVASAGVGRDVVPDQIPRLKHEAESESIPPAEPPPNGGRNRDRYRQIKAVIHEGLLAASPPLTTGGFDRLASRLTAAAYTHAPTPTPAPASGAGSAPNAPAREELGTEARWRDDGGA